MAYATQLTIGTGNRVSVNSQSEEVSVTLTYQLEREDADVLQVVRDKAQEVAAAHRLAREYIRADGLRGEDCSVSTDPELPTREAQEGAVERDTPLTTGQEAALRALLHQAGWSEDEITLHLHEAFNCEEIEELNTSQAARWLVELQRAERLKIQMRSEAARASPSRLNGHS